MKKYNIYLSDKCIGTTIFEYADVSMGVVHGIINFIDIQEPYNFFKEYCLRNNITLNADDETYKLISTKVIDSLTIITSDDKILPHTGSWVEGMDSDVYEIIMVCVDAVQFEKEFPHHVEEYEKC